MVDIDIFLKDFRGLGQLIALERSDSDRKQRFSKEQGSVKNAIGEQEQEIVNVLSQEIDATKARDIVELMKKEAFNIDMTSDRAVKQAKKDIMNECNQLGFSKDETGYLEQMFDALTEGYRGEYRKINEKPQAVEKRDFTPGEVKLPSQEDRESKGFLKSILPFF